MLAGPSGGIEMSLPRGVTELMTESRREQAQLSRLYDQVRSQLEQARDVFETPGVRKLLREIRRRTGTSPDEQIAEIVKSIQDSVRAIQIAESALEAELRSGAHHVVDAEWAANLPARLARFLAERESLPGFTWDVVQDEVRGWMVTWKEYTGDGRIRGYGQFYERPYAWLDD